MKDAISVEEAQKYLSQHMYGQTVRTYNNCMIKWKPILRLAEVWTLVDVPLYKELGAAYNDSY